MAIENDGNCQRCHQPLPPVNIGSVLIQGPGKEHKNIPLSYGQKVVFDGACSLMLCLANDGNNYIPSFLGQGDIPKIIAYLDYSLQIVPEKKAAQYYMDIGFQGNRLCIFFRDILKERTVIDSEFKLRGI